ncbi:MAG: YgaP family membrane protein [Bacilli bacterium]
MKTNVGKLDQILRILVGIASLILGFFFHWGFYLLGAMLIITAFTGFCGIYALFGITTCPRKVNAK